MSSHGVWGHGALRETLARAFRVGTLPTSLLFHGPSGVGKQTLALWLGRLILCGAPQDANPCERCRSCKLALRLEHPDLHWHFPLPRPRGASTPEKLASALEDARHAELEVRRRQPLRPSYVGEPRAIYLAAAQGLRRRAQSRPSMSLEQVFIIADAEHLVPQESSPEAANALLKLLEEPPATSRFILTSSERGRLLSTIRSRTVSVHVPPLDRDRVERFLVEEAGADADAAARAARLAGGSPGRALGFLPDGDGQGPLEALRQQAFQLVRAALDPGAGSTFSSALSFKASGARALVDLLVSVEGWVRDLAAAAAGAPEQLLNTDARDYLRRIAVEREVVAPDVAGALDVVERAREQALANVNPQLIVTGLVAGLRRHLVPRPVASGALARSRGGTP